MSLFYTSLPLFILISTLYSPTVTVLSLNPVTMNETTILLNLKSNLKDPSNFLTTWSINSPFHHCNWTGITCTPNYSFITSINLQSFNLSGQITPSICKIPNLFQINLANNLFRFQIPVFTDCNKLIYLNLSNNLIHGTIPDQFSQISSLNFLDLSKNRIEGKIPESIGLLKQLKVLNLGSNFFTGEIQGYFGNLTQLITLDLSDNNFLLSKIPDEIGKLTNLEELLMYNSGFTGVIPDTFLNLVSLKYFDLSKNRLSGKIPDTFGKSVKKLVTFDVSDNKLSGFFPDDICSGNYLTTLNLHTNLFTGNLPDSNFFTQCVSLERFQVQNNGYFGNFPSGLFLLPRIVVIRGENNKFSGEIPEDISKAVKLEQVQIDNNSFTGVIPNGLGLVTTLYRFSASKNSLHGELPSSFCDSPVMSIINLSENLLSGEIPEVIKCRKLVSLSLGGNSFTGVIPRSLGELPVLTYLDLSDNNLTGSIPSELQNLKLALFNVSYNRLSGSVPFGLLTGLPASYLEGNPDLCGPTFRKNCSDEAVISHQRVSLTKLVCALISIAIAAVVIMSAFGFFVLHRRYKLNSETGWQSVFFYPLRITDQDLVMAINEKTCVGNGGTFGKVHVIGLPSGELIAVKKLVNSGSQSFKALKGEIKTLAKIRHKNVVKILGFCCAEDSIFLIYEYLSNGSLGDIIGRPSFQMEWVVRLRIAIRVAQGLVYLHNDYSPNLLHRDIKSSNILLDVDFEPKLTDFALDRVVGNSAFQSILAFESPPSCYVAPESRYNKKADEQMDVYSFGVVLLELVTGRLAESSSAEESYLDIVKWVRRRINIEDGHHLVLDPRIMNSSKDEMLGALELALQCTSVMPEKRPSMTEVVRTLQSLSSKHSSRPLQLASNGDGSLSV